MKRSRQKQLYLHTSNRVENLARRLVQVSQASPLRNTLSQETVMTLNPGIARWLQFEVAKLTGVSFGWDYPLPGKLFSRVLRGFEPSFDASGAFPEDLARWHLLELLGKLEEQDRFAQVRKYCQSGDGRRRLSFANRLTKLYDEYLVYRPDLVNAWEDDPSSSYFEWQAELWRRLSRKLYPRTRQPRHIARLWQDLKNGQILELGMQPPIWPERLYVFGVSSLAPLYLDLLDHLACYKPVHIFLLQPSDMYWADLKTTKQIQKIAKKQSSQSGLSAPPPEDWLYETGNPLLPAFGKQSQMFLDLLIDKDPQQDDLSFEQPVESVSQLSCLQSDLFTIEDRDCELGSEPFPAFDGTIQVHSCSNRRREVETIWDLIVGRLEADPSLEANDILVMAPDIQKYRSHIESVFKSKRGTELEIPYSIADRSTGNRPGVFSGLYAILKSVSGRATSSEIMEILETSLVRESFSFTDRELECIEFWIRELGITWGWEAKHREQDSSFATDHNTWKELRIRLLSGGLFSENAATPSGFLSYSEIEGDLSDLAGRLLECLELLRALRRAYKQEQPLDHWQAQIITVLDKLKTNREDWQRDYSRASELIRECLPESSEVLATGIEVYAALADKFESTEAGGGYLSGGVTFCSLKPMRAIPANTVCLMGMNRVDFPRRNSRLNFDLMAVESRIGDRNTRDEDRQFFLETLLSVRSHLYISYEGVSPSSDSESEPSAVVEELLRYLQTSMNPEDYEKILAKQKRQSFDPAYFVPGNTQTWDPDRALLRNQFSGAITEQRTLQKTDDPSPNTSEIEEVDLEDLIRFYKDPSKHFATQVAKLSIDRTEEPLSESDELFPSALDRYKLRDRFAQLISLGEPPSSVTQTQAAQEKLLPLGKLQGPSFDEELESAQLIADAVGNFEYEIRYLETEVEGIRLFGDSRVRKEDGRQVIVQSGELKPKNVIECWIRHLFALTLNPDFKGQTFVASLNSKSKPFSLGSVEAPKDVLQKLIANYVSSLCSPLPFFPKLSEAAAKDWADNLSEENEEPMREVIEKSLWNFRSGQSSANQDWKGQFEWTDYDRLCFGDAYEPDERFVRLAVAFWQPYHAAKASIDLLDLKGGAE
ncbi:exodeoxyribonuclease V subunit gamma [Pelagicoccus mobilis]|uniref:Exodeoxyribonuclease V subunit gamma n=1 Tax=Pelagicoccus mobilis TaxID=415221 RepID=A0A934RSW9_9BACT|nr:exodeoxyribonuclease V subunit gamma [Pelagicoccus mobilis]MBK1875833.1 exodeoxyribonuclease V subunit gamma [Pelagicoccus mobilis]